MKAYLLNKKISADAFKNSVVVVGKFDGLHKGHSCIIERAQSLAKEVNAKAVVAIAINNYFPIKFSDGFITPLHHKMKILEQMGVDFLFILDFNDIKHLLPEEFVVDILLKKMSAKGIVVGSDFRFGRDRQGNSNSLAEICNNLGIECSIVDRVENFSSSLIKDLIKQSEMRAVAQLLGRDYSIVGKVVQGSQLARELGYPTANVGMGQYVVPKKGVYVAKGRISGTEEVLQGIVNIGNRPTVSSSGEIVLEFHIFDFNKDIYSQEIEVFLLDYLRGEQKFANIEELKLQIAKDCQQARGYFKQNESR